MNCGSCETVVTSGLVDAAITTMKSTTVVVQTLTFLNNVALDPRAATRIVACSGIQAICTAVEEHTESHRGFKSLDVEHLHFVKKHDKQQRHNNKAHNKQLLLGKACEAVVRALVKHMHKRGVAERGCEVSCECKGGT